jgi:hypothetical protein
LNGNVWICRICLDHLSPAIARTNGEGIFHYEIHRRLTELWRIATTRRIGEDEEIGRVFHCQTMTDQTFDTVLVCPRPPWIMNSQHPGRSGPGPEQCFRTIRRNPIPIGREFFEKINLMFRYYDVEWWFDGFEVPDIWRQVKPSLHSHRCRNLKINAMRL